MAISISKPISDYFWLKKFSDKNGLILSIKELLVLLFSRKYIYMLVSGLLLWGFATIYYPI